MTTVAARPVRDAAVPAAAGARRWRGTRRLLRDRVAVLGVLLVVLLGLAVLAAPLLTSGDPNAVDPTNRFQSPSRAHPFGTDQLGRDVFTRILYGGRLSIGLALAATAGTTVIGLTLGLVSAARGGLVDAVVMRVVDTLQALPGLLLALALVGVLGPSLRNLIIAIVAVWWAGYARLVRSMALTIRERPYVESARAVGASETRILVRYVLPNLLGPAVVMSTLDLGRTLLAVAGLSFLGLGARPPTPEWGAMLAEAKAYLDRAPMLLGYPGLAITTFGLACNLVGDGVRDALDPRFERRGAS
jgi:peptide/nickel transport system permease protein